MIADHKVGNKNVPSAASAMVRDWKRILTPALVIYPDLVDTNIEAMLLLVCGHPGRWRPHLKTAKLESTIHQLLAHGIRQFKCATTLELLTACRAGCEDILFAYPSVGRRAQRVREIVNLYPAAKISIIAENAWEIDTWQGLAVGIFLDINPGMDRTGIGQERTREIVDLAVQIAAQGSSFRGLHYYDGHHRQLSIEERRSAAYPGYEQVLRLAEALRKEEIEIPEIVTSGTPSLACALDFPRFQTGLFKHTVSAGTVVYNDLTSLSQLSAEWGFQPAALVMSSVISHPAPGLITCDAGHKTISADAGFPNCAVMGRPELEPLHASEEHLPIRVPCGVEIPEIGEVLYLVPKHICPTVNNFDQALLARNGEIVQVVSVNARGRECPFQVA